MNPSRTGVGARLPALASFSLRYIPSQSEPTSLSRSSFAPWTMRGSLEAISRAVSVALSISWSDRTRWFSSPMRYASSASTTRAVNSSSLATGHPTCMGRFHVEFTLPYEAARNLKLVFSQPMRMSRLAASTAPPP